MYEFFLQEIKLLKWRLKHVFHKEEKRNIVRGNFSAFSAFTILLTYSELVVISFLWLESHLLNIIVHFRIH